MSEQNNNFETTQQELTQRWGVLESQIDQAVQALEKATVAIKTDYEQNIKELYNQVSADVSKTEEDFSKEIKKLRKEISDEKEQLNNEIKELRNNLSKEISDEKEQLKKGMDEYRTTIESEMEQRKKSLSDQIDNLKKTYKPVTKGMIIGMFVLFAVAIGLLLLVMFHTFDSTNRSVNLEVLVAVFAVLAGIGGIAVLCSSYRLKKQEIAERKLYEQESARSERMWQVMRIISLVDEQKIRSDLYKQVVKCSLEQKRDTEEEI